MGNCFGFGYEGVRGGSPASCFQSCCYGGETPGGGLFALCQSRGAKGEGSKKMIIGLCCAVFLNILGILLIAGGAVLVKHDPILSYVEDVTDHEFLPAYQLAIAIGVFLCISATIACCPLPVVCSGFFLLIAFIMIIVGIGVVSHSVHRFDSDKLEADIKKNMLTEINSTDTVLDFIQQKLECCGVKGPSDWQRNSNFDNKTVPDSCCEVETYDCGKNYRPDDIFHGGCLTKMMEKITIYFRWQIGFVAIFSLIAPLSICFSCCLCC